MILSMLPAPRTRPRTSSVPEIHCCTAAEQPSGDITCLRAGYISSLMLIGNITASPWDICPRNLIAVTGKLHGDDCRSISSPSIQIQERPQISDDHPANHSDKLGRRTTFRFEREMYYFDYHDENAPRKISPSHSRRKQSQIIFNKPRIMSGADHSPTKGNLYNPRRQALDRRKQHVLTTAAVAVGSALLALLCTFAGALLWCKRKKKLGERRPVTQTQLCPVGPRRYSRRELAAATHGFAEGEKIGRGGFGPVYRGYLSDQRRHVAIKVLSQGSSAQGVQEFEAEVRVMTRLRHRNIVQLLGWCNGSRDHLLLVYEFVPNGSLDKHLHDPRRLLSWPDRYRIALGLGSAILYLHTGCEQCVVHGDIKPANVMLDASRDAKLGDFGLARLLDHGADPCTTQAVAGTIGYIDPELVNSRRPSAESDVYSFGIVLLEIACGRRPKSSVAAESNNGASVFLLSWVRDMHRRGVILEAADRRLNGEFNEQQMRCLLATGLWCAHRNQGERPSIAQAMDVLRREDAELPVDLPAMHSPGSVRSLEERAYRDFSAAHGVSENSSAETAYHTSDSAYLLAQQ